MTVKLPEKAGFVPTVQEWDQLVRIAENLAAQLAQAQAERDAARAEAARLRTAGNDLYRIVDGVRSGLAKDAGGENVLTIYAAKVLEAWADLRGQPTPAKE